MALHTQVVPEKEPTPEFDAHCVYYVRAWQHGDMPAREVMQGLKDLAKEAIKDRHLANQARAEYLCGYMQHYMGNLSTSIMHYEKSRQLFDRVGNRQRTTLIDISQGENYRYRGEFKRAQQLYRRAYDSAVVLENVRSQTIAITNEGLALVSLKAYYAAKEALLEGLTLSDHWDDETSLEELRTEIYFGLAKVALALDDPEAAWKHAHQSLQQAHYGESKHAIGLAYRILGDALTAMDTVPSESEVSNPDEYYRAALHIFREIDAQADSARTIFSHACSLVKRKRRRHAAKLFNVAMEAFTKLGMTDDAANAAEAQLSII